MDGAPGPKSEPPTPQNHEAPRPPVRRVSSEETERPPSAQQSNKNVGHEEEEDEVDEKETDEDDIDSDPAEQIREFNWHELHQRYHDVMNDCHIQEAQLAQEWESLMNYFRVWAESGHDHETDRTFQRLKTRTSYVQHSEATLEQKRSHYISVVKAFESALSLLKATSFAR
ncbi:hypothetical protein BDU57DRAFT_458291 [Ampelomyces quisqualis]|uniref:Uncharacterized protein n=1 Tax=Ampelomyces quisqualis TaxID=50730 RepID=A0A6A5Q9F3_AMPQU|nr:hypothetical protein BDU57DRAFT_458291 [Ampelomyces quisqualis]